MFHFRILRAILAAFSVLGIVGLIHAQGEKTSIENCGDLSTQTDMNACAAAEAHKADVALNEAYRELLSKVNENKTASERVVAAERAWIAFRDAELAEEWPVAEGENPNLLYGSVHPFCYYNELAGMTWERVRTLKNLMTFHEGDLCSSGLAQRAQVEAPSTCNSAPGNAKAARFPSPRSHAAVAGE